MRMREWGYADAKGKGWRQCDELLWKSGNNVYIIMSSGSSLFRVWLPIHGPELLTWELGTGHGTGMRMKEWELSIITLRKKNSANTETRKKKRWRQNLMENWKGKRKEKNIFIIILILILHLILSLSLSLFIFYFIICLLHFSLLLEFGMFCIQWKKRVGTLSAKVEGGLK